MAVIPSLAVMAALTLFHTGYGEGSVEDYWQPYAAPATRIQNTFRSYLARAHVQLLRKARARNRKRARARIKVLT